MDLKELGPVIKGVGKTQVLHKLVVSLSNLPFLLCGPPGCGKKCMVWTAATYADYELTIYDISAITYEIMYYNKEAKKHRPTGEIDRPRQRCAECYRC